MESGREGSTEPEGRDTERPRRGRTGGSASRRSTPTRTGAGARSRRASEEIHTSRRRPRAEHTQTAPPAGPPPGSLRAALRLWATRPIAGVAPKNIGRAVVALATVMILVVTGLGWAKVRSLNGAVTLLSDLGLGGGDDGAVDILLVGTDSRVDAKGDPLPEDELKWLRVGGDVSTSTDTIVLVRIPEDGSKATAISIPRDTYVDVPGIGMSKINAAYGATKESVRTTEVEQGTAEAQAEKDGTKAGRKALIDSVANLTGITVDHYAEVGLLGFALLTDAVGGVDVCLKNAVNEPFSGARFRAGRQTLNGPKALSFVRQRHDLPRGDLDRITRQQVYMASLAQKILSTQTLTNTGKLQELQDAVSRSVMIDSGWDILSFVENLKDLTGGNVKFATIPIEDDQAWSDDGTQSVLKVDPQAVHTFVDSQLGRSSQAKSSNPRSDYTVDVVNAGTVDGLASNVQRLLVGLGYGQGATSSKPMNEFDSLIFAGSADNEGAKQLVKDLKAGEIEIREDSSLPENKLRLVLTNTYNFGLGALSGTGEESTSESSATTSSKPQAGPVIKADTDGPVCVN
ncbi:LCP family protein [Gordonia neofelifaecis]|uniref:Cell envelope-like function transcriptional attenuator n=1 Tax=Gordonia neofelifaecis NRRL B-59395 TaxID=644548 RepID=F1YF99_9ACTN|nr:LCP family protein [Gordonia neofelifaecis]EGD56638.1 cell envelope-like function transcriptional attenuator [Gordonia neofelifaecis NRRL B-59395]